MAVRTAPVQRTPTEHRHSADRPGSLAARVNALGATDLFLFRRMGDSRFVHLGGVGRGKGWAGIVELHPEADLRVRSQLSVGRPAWFRNAEPRHVFGPYHARTAVVVQLSHDVVALLGANGETADRFDATDAEVLSVATDAADLIEDVPPSKRLADELEVLHAVRAVADCTGGTVQETLASITRVAAEALSCEVAIVWMPDGRLQVHERGWRLPRQEQSLQALMCALWRDRERLPHCRQDAAETPLRYPLDPASGMRSYYTVAIGCPAIALLVLCHTAGTPRGFTQLCRELGVQLATTADTLLATAILREQLHEQLAQTSRAARLDCLTGRLNRLAWEELTVDLQRRISGAAQAGVIAVDLNELKQANDTRGHEFGDRLLRRLGELVQASVRDGDAVARVGGDEFAVLLPDTDERTTARIAERIAAVVNGARLEGFAVTAAVGSAHCGPGQLFAEAFDRADRAMYRCKAAMKSAAAQRRAV